MSESTSKLAQSKLIILHLLNQIGYPLSNGQISEFTLESNYIEYFSLQEYLVEMVEGNLIELNKENDIARYSITNEGKQILNYFTNHLPQSIIKTINEYAEKNKKKAKKDFEITASYNLDKASEYGVKCSISESGNKLLELYVSVPSKEQAKTVCKNWKANTNKIYLNLLNSLLKEQ